VSARSRHVHLLGVPMDFGAGRRGVDMGPSALRLARLSDTLRELGHGVVDHGNVEVPVAESLPAAEEGAGHARFAAAIAATTASTLAALEAMPAEATPVLLGGDHSVSLGSVTHACARGRTGLLWIDAHGDLNTPANSPSGNVHGMPLAHLLGFGDERLLTACRGAAPVLPEDVVLLGIRRLDPGERALARELGLRVFTIADVDRRGLGAVSQEALRALAHVERLHVSLDADVLDPAVAPGVGTPVVGGLTYREAHLLMELIAEDGRLASLDLVEVNPTLDVQNRTAAVMVELAASLVGKRIL
jgi:arginase